MEVDLGTGARRDTGSRSTAVERPRYQDCKSVLIATDVFESLKSLQTGTDPRLEIRYLVEAAVELVRAQPELAAQLVRQARDRLRRHLALFD